MGIEFDLGDRPDGDLVADRALYLDRTESIIVEEGDPRSAFQFTGKGRIIEARDAERLGLVMVDGRVMQQTAVTPAVAEAPVVEPIAELEPGMQKGEGEAPSSPIAAITDEQG